MGGNASIADTPHSLPPITSPLPHSPPSHLLAIVRSRHLHPPTPHVTSISPLSTAFLSTDRASSHTNTLTQQSPLATDKTRLKSTVSHTESSTYRAMIPPEGCVSHKHRRISGKAEQGSLSHSVSLVSLERAVVALGKTLAYGIWRNLGRCGVGRQRGCARR